jgi:ribose transport system substrate-binding protein
MGTQFMKYVIVFCLAVVVLGSALFSVGCTNPSQPTTPATQTSSPAPSSTAPSPTVSPTKQITIGMIMRDLTAPFSRSMVIGAQNKADALGVKLIVFDAKADPLHQLDLMDQLITMKVDGYIFGGSQDQAAVTPGIERMNQAGIPICAIDSSPVGGKINFFIGFDVVSSSQKAAGALIDDLKKKHGGEVPKGVLIEITGALTDVFAQDCIKGSHAVFDKYSQLTIATGEGNWNNDDSFRRTADLLTKYGDQVVAVYCQTPDIMGLGTVNAIKQAGLDPKKFATAGICIGPEMIPVIEAGDYSNVLEQPAMPSAEFALDLLYKIATGQPVPKEGDKIVQEGAIWSPAEVVNNPYCPGLYMILQGPMVPSEVSPTDPRLWENAYLKAATP